MLLRGALGPVGDVDSLQIFGDVDAIPPSIFIVQTS